MVRDSADLADALEPLMPSTEQLVAAVRAGDKEAFAHLVRQYERAAIVTAYAVVRDYGQAQDAAQDAFVVAYTKINQLHAAAAFGPWLLTIVRRRAAQMTRTHRDAPLEADVAATSSSSASEWLHPYEEVVAQLARLPEHERVVVVLRYVNGHTVQEISDTTGRPAGTVKKQITRGLQRLRNWLKVPT